MMGFLVQAAADKDRGFTLIELIVVIGIIGIIAALSATFFQDMRVRYQIESQVKEFHADIMNARVRATLQNRQHFVTVGTGAYQVTEDTNESGGNAPNAGDTALFPVAKIFKYPVISDPDSWTGTIILDSKGIISDPAKAPLFANAPLFMRFYESGTKPEYDCLVLGPTRINEGRWNEVTKKCIPR